MGGAAEGAVEGRQRQEVQVQWEAGGVLVAGGREHTPRQESDGGRKHSVKSQGGRRSVYQRERERLRKKQNKRRTRQRVVREAAGDSRDRAHANIDQPLENRAKFGKMRNSENTPQKHKAATCLNANVQLRRAHANRLVVGRDGRGSKGGLRVGEHDFDVWHRGEDDVVEGNEAVLGRNKERETVGQHLQWRKKVQALRRQNKTHAFRKGAPDSNRLCVPNWIARNEIDRFSQRRKEGHQNEEAESRTKTPSLPALRESTTKVSLNVARFRAARAVADQIHCR